MDIQEARGQVLMVRVGFQSLTCYRRHEGLLGGQGGTGMVIEVGKVKGL